MLIMSSGRIVDMVSKCQRVAALLMGTCLLPLDAMIKATFAIS
jgi:hypothetical protein